MVEIKDRLKEALEVRSMTAAELSKRSGIGKGSISKYLNGLVVPKQSAIGEMARALMVSPAWLMGYEVSMIPQETLPAGTYRGSADVVADGGKITALMEKLSPNNQEKLKEYAQFLLQQQEGKK